MTVRWCPDRELPSEPFLPGIGKRPPEPDFVAAMAHSDRWMGNLPYLWGVDLFNHGFYWEAHEAWEAAWHAAPDDDQKAFMQALVQLAAGMLKFATGPRKTAAVLAERSMGRLQQVIDHVSQPYMGADLTAIRTIQARMKSGKVISGEEAQLVLRPRSRDFLGALTDLWVQPAATNIHERDGYLVADTPSYRTYYSGHYLLIDRPPNPGEIERWFERWAEDRGTLPGTSRYLVWETPLDETWDAPELPEGTICERIPTMVRRGAIERGNPPPGIELRRISSDADWEKVLALISALGAGEHGGGYADFVRWRYGQYRDSLRKSGGSWWAAFDEDEAVATLGLFESPSLCRFQEVMTKPSHQRRGIATALIARSLASAQTRFKKATAIICPQEGAPAERIYSRLGFAPVSMQHWLMRST